MSSSTIRCYAGLFLLLLTACDQLQDFNLTSDGTLGLSRSVAESRRRKVLLRQYRPATTGFEANGVWFRIREAWAEKAWRHRGYRLSTTQVETGRNTGYNFIVRMQDANALLWDLEFRGEDSTQRGLSGSADRLWTVEYGVPPDTLRYRLVLDESTPGNVVLRFYK